MADKHINELVSECLKGDRDAYESIIREYTPRLYGFFVRMGYASDIAEDLTQELFVRLPDKLKKYQDSGQFDAWFFRVAANMARDHSRKKTLKTVSIHVKTADGECGDMVFADNKQKSPDELLAYGEMRHKLEEALANLSEQEREFILMRHYGQMGFKEIAQQFGVPVGTVLSKVHRGLKKLKQFLS